ncbi:MAG: Colicin V production protein [Firmicutes bacterium ADurb.Bin193]|nr:MAG: Colicin V production protein [Firmicutes bacterium ADurb.Bin193]
MADIVVGLIIAGMALWGWRSGFVRSVFHLGYYIIAAVVALFLYPVVSSYLIKSPLATFIHDKIILPRLATDSVKLSLPPFLKEAVSGGIDGATLTVATSLTELVINIICFIAVFIITGIGLRLAINILDSIAKLPLINIVNKVGGLAIGTFNGFIIVYLVLAAATVFMNDNIYGYLASSKYALKMYNDNLLLKLLFG